MDTNDFGHLAGGSVGYSRFIMTQLAALERATNYAYYRDTAPQAIGAVTGGATGDIGEKTGGAYIEANHLLVLWDRDLRLNAGLRYFHTDQTVTSPVQTGAGIFDQTLDSTYDDFLPSFNATYDVTDRLKVRFSASRSMTRADAGQILPGTTFSDTSGPGGQRRQSGSGAVFLPPTSISAVSSTPAVSATSASRCSARMSMASPTFSRPRCRSPSLGIPL